jgi:hypothetical protein
MTEADLAHATWNLAYATWGLVLFNAVLTIGTVGFLWRQLKDAKAATELNLYLQLVATWEAQPMCAIRSRVAATLLRHHNPTPYDIETILDHLEDVAYHVNVRNIGLNLAWHAFSYPVRCYWHELNNYVLTQRGVRMDRTLFVETEALNRTFDTEEHRRRELPAATVFPMTDELQAFLESEASINDRLGGLEPPA